MEVSKENDNPIISKGQWQWMSNKDSLSDKSKEPEWQSFSLAHNYLIEKAYYDQQKEVIIDDYSIISLRQMMQKKKGDKVSQTPIRRINWTEDEEDADRYKRYSETELPQPANNTSKSLADFLCSFSKESSEISQFTELFQSLEKRNDIDGLNHKIVPELCDSLQKELDKEKFALMTTKIRSWKKRMQFNGKKEHDEKIIRSLKKEFSSFEEFYGQILQTYTMNTLLYQNLNKYLKTENWLEIKNLLPYAFCLCHAFFNQKLNPHKEIQETKFSILYRGSALDPVELGPFDIRTRQDFCWRSIASMTTKKEVAENFMYRSVDLKNNKYPVMFIIEVPTSINYLKWVDVHQYSVMPNEGEVLLAPGTTCILETVLIGRGGITTIRMRLKDDDNENENESELFESDLLDSRKELMIPENKEEMMVASENKEEIMISENKEEIIMRSDKKEEPDNQEELIMPNHMIQKKDKELKVICLEGEELLQALEFISQKRGVEIIEFNSCVFDRQSLEKLFETLSSLNYIKIFRFISCRNRETTNLKNIVPKGIKASSDLKIEMVDVFNFHNILYLNKKDNKYWQSLKSLDISFGYMGKIDDNGLQNFCSKALKHFTQLESLSLDFYNCSNISEEGVIKFSKNGLSHLSHLTSLKLNFTEFFGKTKKGTKNLGSQELRHLSQLTILEINSHGHNSIYLLSEGLKNLLQLRSLKIHFEEGRNTEKMMEPLKLENFTQLTSLTISCPLEGFSSKELRHLAQLKSLDLFFKASSDDNKNPNDRLKLFSSEGLQYLPQLTSLRLRFKQQYVNWTYKDDQLISDPGLAYLASFGLTYLTQLSSLDLEFNCCNRITDEGPIDLFSKGLKYLTQLASLRLKFEKCNQITNQTVSHLCSEVLKNLYGLSGLNLNFSECPKISAEGIKTLATQGLCYQTQLKSLSLEVSYFSLVEEGISHLCSNGLVHLAQLTDLKINILGLEEHVVVHEAILHLFSKVVVSLKQLTSLMINDEKLSVDLNSSDFKDISCFYDDQCSSFNQFAFHRPSNPQLSGKEVFDNVIDHYGMKKIVPPALIGKDVVHQFLIKARSQLKENPRPNRDDKLNILSHMYNFSSLDFDFSRWQRIDREISVFWSHELKSFSRLKSLSLCFRSSEDLTSTVVMHLCSKGLSYLSHLRSLNLDFSNCQKLGGKGLFYLGDRGLRHLPCLESLSLNFSYCRGEEVPDKDEKFSYFGVSQLCSYGLKNLTGLESLDLNFSNGRYSIPIGCESLHSLALKYLPHLRNLNLDFSGFNASNSDIGSGLDHFCFDGIATMTKLTSLNLKFNRFYHLQKIELNSLSYGLQNLTQLTSLDLGFHGFWGMKANDFVNLCSQGMKNLSDLQYLKLDLSYCQKINDESLKKMFPQGLKHLTKLVSLTLKLSQSEITNEGLDHLISQEPPYLTYLTSLTFSL